MKILKVTLSILILFVVVAALAVTALFMFADPNQLKPVIAKAVKTQTGYDLVMNGNLTWSLYPNLGVNAADMSLTAPNTKTAFMSLSKVHFSVDLRALLQGSHQLTGSLYIADANMMKLRLSNIHAAMQFNQGVLAIQPITASVYGGELKGKVQGSNLSALPSWQWDMTVSHANLQTLLADVNGADAKLTIAADANLSFQGQTQGNNGETLYQNVKGTGTYALSQGSIKAIDINYLLQTADALLNKQRIAAPDNMNETAFNSLTGAIRLDNGVLTSTDLSLSAPTFTTKGDLRYTLSTKAVDAHLNIDSTEALKTQFDVPVLVGGTVMQPKVQLDMARINQAVAKQQFEKVKTKVQEQVKELSGKANKFIQNLIGQ